MARPNRRPTLKEILTTRFDQQPTLSEILMMPVRMDTLENSTGANISIRSEKSF